MSAINEFQTKQSEFLDDLFGLLRIPSITRDKESVKEAAHWIINRLRRTSDSAELIQTVGNPVIIAEWLPQIKAEPNQKVPTILFYGHYDVQPPEPLELWRSPPFEPTIREGRIYARGAGDNKGQFYAHLCAIECLHKVTKLGLNVKFLFDGEEELGSPNLKEALESKKQFFTDIDLVIVSDGPADLSWRPTIVFGVRGIVTAQLYLQSAVNDVHSGNFGGIQPNPALDLVQILQTFINDQGKCLMEDFYTDVFDPDSLAIEAANQLDRTPKMYKEALGISYFGGEQDQPLVHRVMFRPTFNIRGFHSGAVREKAKTIIPKDAIVEIDMRLVPHQNPKKIEKLVITHLERLKQQSSRWSAVIDRCEINFEAHFSPMYTPLNLPWTETIEDSIREGFGQEPMKIPLLGGSLPLYKIYEVTGKPLYIIPYAQPDQGNHAPNENLMLEWFECGVQTSIKLLENLSRQ